MDKDRLEAIDRELRDAELTLDQLEDGTYWSAGAAGADDDDDDVQATAGATSVADDATVELDPDVTAELSPPRTR